MFVYVFYFNTQRGKPWRDEDITSARREEDLGVPNFLFQHAELFADLNEGGDALVELFAIVTG